MSGEGQAPGNPSLDVPSIRPDGRLDGLTAVVTGAGSHGALTGSGSAIAVMFAAKGANVVIVDRDAGRAEHTSEAIGRTGGKAVVHITDITVAANCRAAADVALDTFGSVDVLVNNAAIAPGEQANTEELWDTILSLNLKAAKLMTDAVLPAMKRQGKGSVINITSIAALRGGGGIAYSASKGGLNTMTKAMAFEYGRFGVRVNNVAPGHNALPMGLGFQGWEGASNQRKLRAEAGLLGYEGNGWDLAYAALFLASDESRWVTAATLPVDAGTTQVFPIVMHPILTRAEES
ncbi:MAG TPA: SDR family oxidoreductase [Streptosporangiaceae bacterium]|jgi:NAD(P)-dependent dehydrogenase (short-subunit alcohol dehydrogenase family)|nr:SDR family oxidoreductase [Streptosporangiaceae bacterium]